MENRGSTLILTNIVGVHLRNIHTKLEANLCNGLKKVEKLIKFTPTPKTTTMTTPHGHRVIARVTLTH